MDKTNAQSLIRRAFVYASFVKLEHTIFSLPLIYAGVLLGAGGWPSLKVSVLILLATIGGRVTAMGLNRLIDVEIDRRNPRTTRRELPRGAMQAWEGWLVVAVAGAIYVISAAAIAPVCLQLSPIPVALFVGYPYLKRFTSLSHLGLGLAWSMAPLGGWLAASVVSTRGAILRGVEWSLSQSLARFGEIGWLWLFSLLWVVGFDIVYATMDEAFDREFGLHSLPVRLGRRRALRVALILHTAAFLALFTLWYSSLRSPLSLAWLLGIGALFLWQHAIADRNPGFAFFQLNGAIGFLVFGFVLAGI